MPVFEGKCTIDVLWNQKLPENFNIIKVGKVFRQACQSLVTGCEDGVIRIYDIAQIQRGINVKLLHSLETKGGPIQALAVHDVTRFGATDLVVGDSRGSVTIFCQEQILSRSHVSDHSIDCMQIQQDDTGHVAVVTGDSDGNVCALLPYSELWRIRARDHVPVPKSVSGSYKIKSLLSLEIPSCPGVASTNYILASDSCRNLYIIQQGSVVKVIQTPCVISAMTCGKFAHVEGDDTAPVPDEVGSLAASKSAHQVALGGETGAIYILHNFQILSEEYANIELPITKLSSLPGENHSDLLLCAGYFNSLIVVQNGKELCKHTTPDWVNSIVVTDRDNILLGCIDNTVQSLRVKLR
ncbi:uncharacterized protein LOC106152470 [Lingula anatina]|uniref:Uncharacterized protein LOC106152470 n=1 Tax=Lingula anatina TaxID=7574 RepID=A0A1S3H688_LINAN|nr:uncharacterized protein LOC106152470 [Lingula anatina]|eukprot:XP_013381513.1 uncharacterized protein LOC106152470 [Lingula anatina]